MNIETIQHRVYRSYRYYWHRGPVLMPDRIEVWPIDCRRALAVAALGSDELAIYRVVDSWVRLLWDESYGRVLPDPEFDDAAVDALVNRGPVLRESFFPRGRGLSYVYRFSQ